MQNDNATLERVEIPRIREGVKAILSEDQGTPEVLKRVQVAALLQVHPNTIRNWQKNIGLPYIQIGKTTRFPKKLVLDWFEKRLNGAK